MPKIISVFNGESPIGDTLAKLGNSLWGNSTDNALKSEQLYAAQRQNVELDNLMKRAAANGVQTLGDDPLAQAILLGSGYDPSKFAEIGRMGAAVTYGADDPRTVNWQIANGQDYADTATGFNRTLAETARNNDLQSADRRNNVEQDVALKKWLNDNISAADRQVSVDRRYNTDQEQLAAAVKPIAAYDPVKKTPVFVPTNQATAMQPLVSETERKGQLLGENFNNLPSLNPQQQEVLGARVTGDKAGTPKNYILPGGKTLITYDGVTEATTGQRLPPGGYIGTVQGSAADTGVTNAVKTDLQTDMLASDKFTMLGKRMLNLANTDPSAFGLVGNLQGKAQEAGQAVKAVGSLFGDPAKADAAIMDARKQLANAGLAGAIPSLYNPNLPKVQMLGGLMLYSAASALGGQENRSVSDADIKKMKSIIGDPQGVFESAESIKVKVGIALEIVAAHKALAQQYLAGHPGATTVPEEAGLVDAAIGQVLDKQPATPSATPTARKTRTGIPWSVEPQQ